MSPSEIGGILIVLGILAFVFGKFATLRSVALFTGTVLVGVGGHLFGWLATVLTWLAGVTSAIFAWGFGVAVPGLLAIILAWILIHAWHPRNKSGRMASIAAVALGVMVAAGITSIGALNQLPSSISTTVSTTTGG